MLGQVWLAHELQTKLPATWAAWRAGDIDGYKANKVAETAQRLIDPARIPDFDAAAATAAVAKTGPQLSTWLSRTVARIEPDQVEARYRRAFAERRVDTSLTLDGMGSLWATTNAIDLTAIDYRHTRLAQDLGADDPRTLEQRRADVFVDLLLGQRTASDGSAGQAGDGAGTTTTERQPAGRVAVAVTVPVQSLLGLDDTPGTALRW